MFTKLVEVRDRATFIPCIAIRLQPVTMANQFLLASAGYGRTPDDQAEYVLFARAAGGQMCYDSAGWGDRTMSTAHEYVVCNWDTIVSGDVVDVEFILGETDSPKQSERPQTETPRCFFNTPSP